MSGLLAGLGIGFLLALAVCVRWAWDRPPEIATNYVRATVVVPGVAEDATGPENIRAIQRALDILQGGGGTIQFPRGAFLVGGGSAIIYESVHPINLHGPVTFTHEGPMPLFEMRP